MASFSGVRVNVFNENFLNDSEQDANSVLTELDKSLRSPKIGVQCEAIVRFPKLFEKYPFPILINSSFLKLSEFYFNGSNLLRFWILRVCQQSENHLNKILNIDAFVKRIFMVIHSNDPIARAITLRTLGAVSRVIPEKQQVHHAIRRALDSNDTVEVEAAIYASGQFAAQSRSFSISMCARISNMIESLQVPLPMKLQLIPVLRHMHHDVNTATLVKELCLNLLLKYPEESFVVAILDSLTQLSARTLTGVPEQLKLLLNFLNDSRKPVRAQVLQSLITLADNQCVHAWPQSITIELIDKAKDCINSKEQYLFLSILLRLSDCPLPCHTLVTENRAAIVDLCNICLSLDDYNTASQALAILAALVVYIERNKEQVDDILDVINLHIEALLFCTSNEEKYKHILRKILICGVRVASARSDFGSNFVKMLVDHLLCDDVECLPVHCEIMCDTLGALSSQFQLRKFTPNENEDILAVEQRSNPVLERLPHILHKLNELLKAGNGTLKSNQLRAIEILTAVMLQSMIGCYVPHEIIEWFDLCCERTNGWTLYRIARSACRYGQHFIAAKIFDKIARNVDVDKSHFFLVGLGQVGKAECILNYGVEYEFMHENYIQCDPQYAAGGTTDDGVIIPPLKTLSLIQRLELATNLYWQALASLRAGSSSVHALSFQLELLKLRAQFLQTLHLAVTIKNAQIIVPPPAIASSLAQNSRDYLQKFGHVTNQLRKLVKIIKGCEESYSRLYKSAFDADVVTLEFLEIAEYQCALLANIIENICYATASDPPTFLPQGEHPETRYFAACCHNMSALQKNIPQEAINCKTIGNRHLEVIIAEIELITKTPLCLPRYLFQVLQSTQIKLSVSPQPRSPGEPVIVQSGSNLVIKVEGVIVQLYNKRHSIIRAVDAVQLSLHSQLMTPRPANELGLKPFADSVTLKQTVKPQRDFLSTNFLLPISSGGQWQVTLETFVVDKNGVTWCTGPKNTMLVRVLDDPNKPTSTAQAVPTRR